MKLNKPLSFAQIEAFGKQTAKVFMVAFALMMLGAITTYCGAGIVGWPLTKIGFAGVFVCCAVFAFLLSEKEKKIRSFVLDYRNGARMMGMV